MRIKRIKRIVEFIGIVSCIISFFMQFVAIYLNNIVVYLVPLSITTLDGFVLSVIFLIEDVKEEK